MTATVVVRPYQHPGAAAHGIPGRAGRLVASWGERAEVHRLTDSVGLRLHADVLEADAEEVRRVLGTVLPLPGPVLDLAEGLGRMTLPLLALGRQVSAVVSSDLARQLVCRRLERGPDAQRRRCLVTVAELPRLVLPATYGVAVLSAPTVGALDAEARAVLFGAVRRHLRPDGRVLLTAIDHGASALPVESVRAVASGSGRNYRVFEYWEPGSARWTLSILPMDLGPVPVRVASGSLRVVDVREMERELNLAGLTVCERSAVRDAGQRHPRVVLEATLAEPRARAS